MSSENISLLPALEWSSVEGADSYTLHINVDGQPDVQIDVLVEGTTYTVSDSLAYGTSYEWKVQAAAGSIDRRVERTEEVYNRTRS